MEDKVIVQVTQVEEKTESGLYIPDSATAMPDQGVVVSVGPGRYAMDGTLMPTGINVGDVFRCYSYQRFLWAKYFSFYAQLYSHF